MTTMPELSQINQFANTIHEWGESRQPPWKRMGLARLGSAAFATVEVVSLLYQSAILVAWQLPVGTIRVTLRLCNRIIPRAKRLQATLLLLPKFNQSTHKLVIIAKLVAGIASTLFFGIVFSPEVNFRIHLLLNLAVDNLSVKRKKELKAKLEMEDNAVQIRKEREATFVQFETERNAEKANDDEEDNRINADLAALLTPPVSDRPMQT